MCIRDRDILRNMPTLAFINGKQASAFWQEQNAEADNKEAVKKKEDICPPAEGKIVDLLSLLKPEQHTAMGAWQMRANPQAQTNSKEIHAAETGDACLVIPYRPAEEYDVRMFFSATPNNNLIFVVLTVPERKRAFAFVIKGRSTCGFEAISGGLVPQNSSSEKLIKPIGGDQYALAIQVRKTGVQAFLDSEAIAQYKTTSYAPFTLPKAYPPPVMECLEVGCNGGIIIRHLAVVEISGKGEILDIKAQPYAPPVDEPKPIKEAPKEQPREPLPKTVSYTHLTLPTIYSV